MLEIALDENSVKFRVQSWADSDTARRALTTALGAACPGARVLGIGPKDWIVVAPKTAEEPLRKALQGLSPESGASGVEVSAALVRLTLSGSRVREVLTKGCALDLHPREAPPGFCARTRLAQVAAILHCVDDSSRFDVYVNRSYVAHLTSWLRTVGGENART